MTEWGWETSTAGLSWQPGEAEGSRTRETPGRVESSPDNAGTCWHCQTARVRLARRKGVREKPVHKAPQSAHQLKSGGYGLGCGAHRPGCCWSGTPRRMDAFSTGGHGECPRRSRGDAAGAELDADPADRYVVNVGTVRCRPCLVQPARERAGALSAVGTGRGGGLVVVAGVTTRHGGRESRPQGEGGQQVRCGSMGRPGGRW